MHRILIVILFLGLAMPAWASRESIHGMFGDKGTLQRVMWVEAAIAQAQASHGIIPQSAADEIREKADLKYLPLEEYHAEHKRVHHRMVAALNVWKKSLSPEAANAVHFGVTTVDVYDTVLAMQMRDSLKRQMRYMRDVETRLMDMANENRDTPMMGRTLGQHAMPITFGKKVAVWAAANRRNIDRAQELLTRIDHLAILKGAVGTYAGLGDKGVEVEAQMAKELGFAAPDPADWHGMRDVVAEYGTVQALIARTYAALGEEIFRLQGTDIGEVYEDRGKSAVGSSTMPQKRNPGKSNALIHGGRMIPALSQVLLDDVVNSFERDDTSRPNETVGEIAVLADQNTRNAALLLLSLRVDPGKMRANMDRTGGLVMSQHVVLFLAPKLGRDSAEEHVRAAAAKTLDSNIPFKQTLLGDPLLEPVLRDQLDTLLDPAQTLGLSGVEVDRVLAQLREKRANDPEWMKW